LSLRRIAGEHQRYPSRFALGLSISDPFVAQIRRYSNRIHLRLAGQGKGFNAGLV